MLWKSFQGMDWEEFIVSAVEADCSVALFI